jgi:hypothetical protein
MQCHPANPTKNFGKNLQCLWYILCALACKNYRVTIIQFCASFILVQITNILNMLAKLKPVHCYLNLLMHKKCFIQNL